MSPATPPHTDPTPRSGAAPLAYERSGEGIPVVLLHGLTFDRRTWRPIIRRLGGRVLSIAIDLPGHGESPGSGLAFARLITLIRAQLDGLGVELPVVVGHSMSGGLAMEYAAQQPVRGAVNVDAPLDLRPFASLIHRLAPALRGDAFAETFHDVFQASMGLDRLAPDIREAVLAGQRIRQDLVLDYWAELLETEPDVMQARVHRAAAAIDVPVLGVFGRELEPPEREWLARIPDAAWEEWPDGHFVHLVEPDRFADRLLAFVAHCETAARRPRAGRAGVETLTA
jgi:pimeloyl-ACP methyl ester carboxylesterase